MTNKDMIEIMLQAPSNTNIVAYRTFLKDMLKNEEKYKWHDLRKNPEDLPRLYQDVFVVNDDGIQHVALVRKVNWGNELNPYMVSEWCIKYCCYDTDIWEEQENGKIIAWREIEPFEEEANEQKKAKANNQVDADMAQHNAVSSCGNRL